MPGPSHNHSAKMERCLEDLTAKGHSPGSAHAICYTSLGSEANKREKHDPAKDCPICKGIAEHTNKSGRVIQKDAKRRYTLGIVYEPDELDTDKEFSTADEIEKACWDFMRDIQGRSASAKIALNLLGEISAATKSGDEIQIEIAEDFDEIVKRGVSAMHTEDLEDSEIVECFIAPVDMKIDGESVKKGSWLAGIIWDEKSFEKIDSGKWTGYSMGGWAKKEDIDG